MQRKYDVLLQDGETAEQVRDMLENRFGVTAAISPQQWNCAPTLVVDGSIKQLMQVTQWHNAPRAPRPDLQGTPPVAKGEKRTQP
jgi:hypothetical protein